MVQTKQVSNVFAMSCKNTVLKCLPRQHKVAVVQSYSHALYQGRIIPATTQRGGMVVQREVFSLHNPQLDPDLRLLPV